LTAKYANYAKEDLVPTGSKNKNKSKSMSMSTVDGDGEGRGVYTPWES
jgi:hypothetical protein